ncbi:MAG: hypothetical protein J6S53_07680 [Lentisphaeria bacterium]|nr:hypothetical protein [Lentisphaeria bacterium]
MKFSSFAIALSLCLFSTSGVLYANEEYSLAAKALKEGKFFRPDKNDGTHNNFFKPLTPPKEDHPLSLWLLPEGELQLRYVMANGRSGMIRISTAANKFIIPANAKKKIGKKNVSIGQYMINFTDIPLKKLFIKPNPEVIDAPILSGMDLKKYPDANKELLHLKMVQKKESLSFCINGSYAGSFREGKMASITAVLHPRSAKILELSKEEKSVPGFEKILLSSRAKNDIPAVLSFDEPLSIPIQKNITHGVDMRKIRPVADKAGYRNKDLSRTAFDGLDTSFLMSVPAARYMRGYVLAAPIPGNDRNMLPAFRMVMTRYAKYGRADAAIVKAEADLSSGSRDIRKVGTALLTLKEGKKKVPLYLVKLDLPFSQIEDIISGDTWTQLPFRDFLDIDLQGPGGRTTKETMRSSLAIFAISLQKTPVDIVLKQKMPGNLFTPEDGPVEIPVEVTGKKAGKYVLSYVCKDVDNKKVLNGKNEFTIQNGEKKILSLKLDPPGKGYFSLELALWENGEILTTLPTSFVKLASYARKWKSGTSPYSSWYWGNAHNLPADMDQWGSILKKLGIFMVSCATTHSEAEWQKYGISFAQFPNMLERIYSEKNILSDDPVLWEKMEKELIRQVGEMVKRYPSCKKILLQHESYQRDYAPLPVTLLKKAPRKWDEKREKLEKARAKAAARYCQIIRKNFPHLKIVFGNACWAQEMIESFAARGFDPSLVDYIGCEAVGSWVASPESFSLWNPDGSAYVLRETARVNGFKTQPITATYEWSCRSSNPTDNMKDPRESAIRQAQWLMRDVMTAFAYKFDSIPLMSVTDTGTAYNNGRTYGALGCMDRQFNPKPLAAAIATVTGIMDQVQFVKSVDSPADIYLFEFKREDGKNIYALWTSKGSAKCRIKVKDAGSKLFSCDLYGREKFYTVKNASIEAEADGSIRYFITEGKLDSLTILARKFPVMEEPEKLLQQVNLRSSLFERVREKDERIDGRAFNDRSFQASFLVPSTIRDVKDAEKGESIAVKFDISTLPEDYWYHGGYTMYRFKKPIPIPAGADGIGMWVKGNSSLGRLAWEIRDNKGNSFISNGEPRNGANMLNAMYDNEFYSSSWRFMYMALTPLMAQPKNWFSLQWHGKGAVGIPREVTGILLSTSNKLPRIFELRKVTNQEIRFRKMVFFSAPGITEEERLKAVNTLSPEAKKAYEKGKENAVGKKDISHTENAGGELVSNGSFQRLALPSAKQIPSGWHLEGSEFPVNWEMHPVPSRKSKPVVQIKQEGKNHFLWMEGTFVCTKVPLKTLPGGKYFFKGKVKGSGILAVRFFYQGGTSKAIRFRGKATWQEISGTLELPSGKNQIYLVLQQGAGKGDIAIDDISLQIQK